MPSEEEKLANKVFLAARDMGEVGDYLWSLKEIAKNRGNLSEYRLKKAMDAMLIAAIVVYSRHFTNTYSLGNASRCLKPEEIKLFDGRPELAALHEKIIGLRNQAIAHADWNYYPTALVKSDEEILGFSREFNRIDYMALIDTVKFEELVEHNWKVISDSAYLQDSTLARKASWHARKRIED